MYALGLRRVMVNNQRLLPHYAQAIIRDPAGSIQFWGQGPSRRYGFSAAEAVGRISHELLRTEFPHPLRLIEEELLDMGEWEGEVIHYRQDGHAISVLSHWELWHKSKMVIEVHADTL